MQPLYDPVRSLLYAAGERAIRHVFVGGQQIVRDGKALAFDYADASARLINGAAPCDREGARIRVDWARRRGDDAADLPVEVNFRPARLSFYIQASAVIEIGVARNDPSRATTLPSKRTSLRGG